MSAGISQFKAHLGGIKENYVGHSKIPDDMKKEALDLLNKSKLPSKRRKLQPNIYLTMFT